MIWKTTDYKGNPVTWYSGDVIDRIKKVVQDNLCKNCPEPCNDKMVEPCTDKQVFDIIESEGK